jgi:hypothetical protein
MKKSKESRQRGLQIQLFLLLNIERLKLMEITNHKTQITNKPQHHPKKRIPNMFGSLNIGIWDF